MKYPVSYEAYSVSKDALGLMTTRALPDAPVVTGNDWSSPSVANKWSVFRPIATGYVSPESP